jgi:hypothetical protein
VTTRKSVNREVFEGADLIGMRLRAAKKPAVIPFLEIPPEEIDLEPVTLEPIELTDAEPMTSIPRVIPMSEILPFDDHEDDNTSSSISDTQLTKDQLPPTLDASPAPLPTTAESDEGISLFGVGKILGQKPTNKK